MSNPVSTATARLALLGAVLQPTTNDRNQPMFVVNVWATTRFFDSLDEVERFIERLEALHAHGAPAGGLFVALGNGELKNH